MLSSPPAAAASLASRRAAHRRGAGAPTPASSRIRGPAIVRGPERRSRAPATRSELLDWRSYGAVDGRRARGASDLGGAGVSGRSAPADAADAAAYHRRSRGIILPARRGRHHHPADDVVDANRRLARSAARVREGTSLSVGRTAGNRTRRSLLLGASALSVAGAASLALPPPSRAFIDLPSRLHNRYFLVRHGESSLDTRGIFLSNPSFKYDTTYGLTRLGAKQMHEAARVITEEYDGAPSWLYTSNFQRSFQSALILREDLGMLFSQLRTEFSGLLDPRKMGDLDFKPTAVNWEKVWAGDLRDPLNTPPPVPASLQPSASVESPRDLYRRALEAFTRLESTYFGEDVILVSHADTLSLFTAALMGTELTDHHKDWAMELGEVRCVDLSAAPVGGDSRFSPTDLRGEYAVGDKAVNYLEANRYAANEE